MSLDISSGKYTAELKRAVWPFFEQTIVEEFRGMKPYTRAARQLKVSYGKPEKEKGKNNA